MSSDNAIMNAGTLDAEYIPPESEADYTIWVDGATYYAKNGHTGKITNSINAASLIQNMINTLTSGRTWMETLYLKGKFVIDSNIKPTSYTRIIIDGELFLAANSTQAPIFLDNVNNIEIIGGTINVNKANQINAISGITSSGGEKIKILNIKIHDASAWGIYLHDTSHVIIKNCDIFDCEWSGICMESSTLIMHSIDVSYNHITGCGTGAGATLSGISSESLNVLYPILYFNIHHNEVENNANSGIGLFGYCNYFTISYNDVYENDVNGISIYGCQYGDISYNKIIDNAQDDVPGYRYGISVDDTGATLASLYVLITHNYIDNTKSFAISTNSLADYITISYNDLTPNPFISRPVAAIHDKINNNIGYITESSGSATILNTTTSIVVTHGCSYTPTATDISITPTATCTNDPGMIWVSAVDGTNFTVNCMRDPGVSGLAFSWAVRKV